LKSLNIKPNIKGWFSSDKNVYIEVLKHFNMGAGDPELDTVASSLVTAVANGLKSRGVYLLLPSHATGAYSTYVYSGRRSSGRLNFPANSPLVTTLKQRDGTIEISAMASVPSLAALEAHDRDVLTFNEIELIAPLRNAGHLAGIILVGRSITGVPYSRSETRALEETTRRVASTIDDANF
jgi:hypothetical protein